MRSTIQWIFPLWQKVWPNSSPRTSEGLLFTRLSSDQSLGECSAVILSTPRNRNLLYCVPQTKLWGWRRRYGKEGMIILAIQIYVYLYLKDRCRMNARGRVCEGRGEWTHIVKTSPGQLGWLQSDESRCQRGIKSLFSFWQKNRKWIHEKRGQEGNSSEETVFSKGGGPLESQPCFSEGNRICAELHMIPSHEGEPLGDK